VQVDESQVPASVKAKVKPQPASAFAAEAPLNALGLPRVQTVHGGVVGNPLTAAKFTADPLEAPAGGTDLRRGAQHGAPFLAIAADRDWSRPLRGNPHETQFVSITLLASVGTILNVDGAWLAVEASATKGRAEIMIGDPGKKAPEWRRLRLAVPLAIYGGSELADVGTLTLRLDPDAGVWDVFTGTRMIAHDIVLDPASNRGARKLCLHAGDHGAWVSGLLASDENPLFLDANANGIDDTFELAKNGALLAGNSPAAARHTLIADWQKAQLKQRPPVMRVIRPLPDSVALAASSPGKP